MKVCIVGASGKLGQYMVQHCLDRGHHVVGVCREQSVPKLDRFAGRVTVVPGATDDRDVIARAVSGCDGVLTVLVPWGVHGYATGTAQAVLDLAPPGARLVFSCGWHVTRDGKDVYTWKLKTFVKVFGWIARLLRFADLDDQLEATRRVFESDTRWTVVRGSDLEEGESEGLPVWSRHVGDPILASNRTRRVDFALFIVAALDNDELVHEAPAIVSRLTPSALAHADGGEAAASRICLLTTQDLDADPFPDDDWPCDPRPYIPEAHWEAVELLYGSSVQQVKDAVERGFDVFFNLCDGAEDEERPGIEVVQTLEELCVPFTGADSEGYEPTRERVKEICRERGVDVPRGMIVRDDVGIEEAARALRYPLFVKHYNSYASVDLSRCSRVRTPAGLARQARKIISRHGAALVEEYVAGIECTVLVAENPENPESPTTYQPMEYRFPPGEHFKHADLKWVDYDDMECHPVEAPALAARLRHASAQLFAGVGGAGFGRCDLRVTADGRPFMLEINANCGVYYPPDAPGSADLCLQQDPAGHEGFTRQLVAAALARHQRRKASAGAERAAS